jgi:predicted transcriptional regulator
MDVKSFADKLKGTILTGDTGLDRQVSGMYTCDLLSWVISHTRKGDAWVTVHTNLNAVAVALLAELSCIIIPEGIKVEEATIDRAVREGIPIVASDLGAYKICCIAYDSGILPVEAL